MKIQHASAHPSAIPTDAELEARISAVEVRMATRRGALMGVWHDMETRIAAVVSPRAWFWPLGLSAAAGCLLGLLWRRGKRSLRKHGEGQGEQRPAAFGWRQLAPLVQRWLRPAALEAAEAILFVLIGGLLKSSARAPRGQAAGVHAEGKVRRPEGT